MLQDVSDHEPEFTSLKREVVLLCAGPAMEPTYSDKVAPLCMAGCPLGRELPKPGQEEQNSIIEDYDRRLEALRRKMEDRLGELNKQMKKGQELESKADGLSSWLSDIAQRLADLRIWDPKSSAISSQLQDCQV